MNDYTDDDIVKGTDIKWNDYGEGISIYEAHDGGYGLYYWEDEDFSSVILDTLEEAIEWRERSTRFFRIADSARVREPTCV